MILPTLLLGLTLQQNPPEKVFRFEVDVHTVYVDVSIARGDEPVTNLTAHDFVVMDNGVAQAIDIVDPQTVYWSILLLLDTSASLYGEKLEHLRGAAHAFVDGLSEDHEAGLMTFAEVWHVRQGLTRDFESIHDALDQPIQGGFTGLNDALYAALKLVGEGTGRPMILVFTDGVDNASWLRGSELMDLVQELEAVINVVSIKSSEKESVRSTGGNRIALRVIGSRDETQRLQASEYMHQITHSTGGRTWYADTSANLSEVFLNVLRDMESRYLLSYQLRGVPGAGWHKIEVKLKNPQGAEIRSRTGYTLGKTGN